MLSTIRSFQQFKLIFQQGTKSILQKSSAACYSTFTARDFQFDDSHGESGTLNTRFIKHIAIEGKKHEKVINQTIKYADYFPISDPYAFCNSLKNISTDQLPRFVIFAYTYKSNGDPQKVSFVLNEIDKLCMKRLNDFDYDGLLSMLYSIAYLVPNKITKFDFYRNAIVRLCNEFDSNYHKDTFVQVCYYLGLWKKNSESMKLMSNFLKSHLNAYIDKLDKMSLAIVANAAFKLSTLISDINFTNRLIKETINCDHKDDAILITFVKSLRLERVKSSEVYEKLKSFACEQKLNNYDYKGLVHIFAYFSDGLHNDPKICEILPKLCMDKMKECISKNSLFNDLREKDIATFVWCCANLQNKLNTKDLDLIERIILSRIQHEKYKYIPDELIDTVLSLWIMNYKTERLITEVLKLENIHTQNNNERVKLDSRLKLLRNCICIENPEWLSKDIQKLNIFDENRDSPEYLYEKRYNLNKVYEILTKNKNKISIESVKFILPIKELNITSIKIELTNGQQKFIDVMEKNQMLAFDDKECSLIQLKSRLMEKCGHNIILIKPNEIEMEDNLLERIKTELNVDESINSHQSIDEEKLIN